MTYGLMILTEMKKMKESKRRLFRKKRQKLINRTNLKRIKNGGYLLPFEDSEPSEDEVEAFEQIESLIRKFHVRAAYFVATQVVPEHLVEGDPFEGGRLDFTRMKSYFVLRPIKTPRK